MAKAGRGADQFMVRLPDGMRDQLKESAAANGRSMNAEIVARIEAALSLVNDLRRIEADVEVLSASVAQYKKRIDETQDQLSDEISRSNKLRKDATTIVRGLLSLISKDYSGLDDSKRKIVGDAIGFVYGVPLIDNQKVSELRQISNMAGDFYYTDSGQETLSSEEKENLVSFIRQELIDLINPTLEYLEREGWKLTPPEQWPSDKDLQKFVDD